MGASATGVSSVPSLLTAVAVAAGAGGGRGGEHAAGDQWTESHRIGTSKLKIRVAPARTAVTSTVQVPGEGRDAPTTDTWSAVTGVTGNLRAGKPEVAAVTCTASTASGPPPSRK